MRTRARPLAVVVAAVAGLACGGGGGDTAVAPPPRAVASVAVTPSSVDLTVGASASLVAEPRDAAGRPIVGRAITWSSSAPGVATVNASGQVAAVAPGTATVSATVDGVVGAATVAVRPVPVVAVVVAPDTATVVVGGTVRLIATPRDAAGAGLTGRAVAWVSEQPAVATVTADGIVTGVTAGHATIRATSEGISGSARVAVVPPPVARVDVSPTALDLVVGQSSQLVAIPRNAAGGALDGRSVAYTSSAPAVASVSASGLVSALAPGSAIIRVTAEGVTAQVLVTVANVPVASVLVSPASASLTSGQSVALVAVARDAAGNSLEGRPITWSTSAPAVATVSPGGIVTGVAAGTATVSAAVEGRLGIATITVTAVAVANVTLQPNPATLAAGEAGYFTVSLTDATGNALTGRPVSWQSGNPSIAAVMDDGLVIGLAAGTTTITASSGGKSGSATLVVTAASGVSVCALINGASVYGWDGRDYTVFLGKLTNRFDSQSIYNTYGTYGSQYSSTSIYNPYGTWGSRYSDRSAFNAYASHPPVLVKGGTVLAYFTVNRFKTPYVTPQGAEGCGIG